MTIFAWETSTSIVVFFLKDVWLIFGIDKNPVLLHEVFVKN